MTETNRQRAESAIDVAYDSTSEHAGVQAQLATAHALLAVADEIASLRDSLISVLKTPVVTADVTRPPTCWAPPGADGLCVSHGRHPHQGAKCLNCPPCSGHSFPTGPLHDVDPYGVHIAHVEETGLPATSLRAARATEGGGA